MLVITSLIVAFEIRPRALLAHQWQKCTMRMACRRRFELATAHLACIITSELEISETQFSNKIRKQVSGGLLLGSDSGEMEATGGFIYVLGDACMPWWI